MIKEKFMKFMKFMKFFNEMKKEKKYQIKSIWWQQIYSANDKCQLVILVCYLKLFLSVSFHPNFKERLAPSTNPNSNC